MNEELVKKAMSDISDNPKGVELLLDSIGRCVTMHKLAEQKMLDFVFFSGPLLTKEGGEVILEALRRRNDKDDEKQKLNELKLYWLENYDGIVSMIRRKGPLR